MLLLVPLVALACGADGPDGGTAKPADANAEPVDAAPATAAALDVRAAGCGPRVGFGTGTLIEDQLVVTAAHVVAGATTVLTIDVDGVERTADVVLFDPDLDLAVLRSDRAHTATPMPVSDIVARADDVGIVVLPRARFDGPEVATVDVEVVDVRVVRRADIVTTDIYLEGEVTRSGFEIEGPIDPGDSGASIVTQRGAVGIVWARSRNQANHAWAIDFPDEVTDPERRRNLATASPADVGPCRQD